MEASGLLDQWVVDSTLARSDLQTSIHLLPSKELVDAEESLRPQVDRAVEHFLARGTWPDADRNQTLLIEARIAAAHAAVVADLKSSGAKGHPAPTDLKIYLRQLLIDHWHAGAAKKWSAARRKAL